ncbi:MAG: NAD(P)/FAD-dependent oxidoreductase [Candidatus Sericytochromatia bacterium]|nr:NAD(P)/FAD-dependent oxidoreductase [Candidatus Sericytochromatia bacterium]
MRVIVLGAGPAGMSCAYELDKLGHAVTVFDKDKQVGGLAKTIQHGPFRLDLGPHRFYALDPVVNRIWQEILGPDLRVVPRLTRIYYNRRFFFYPLRPFNALMNLGVWASLVAVGSYLYSKVAPFPREDTFEEWVSNRFGRQLYRRFFQSYTEKVWGIPCGEIAAEWASQRIQGLSLWKAVINACGGGTGLKTLVDAFTYPRLGTGMAYERIRDRLTKTGQTVALNHEVVTLYHAGNRITGIDVRAPDGTVSRQEADAYVASIPLTLLVQRLDPPAPPAVIAASQALRFRNTILVYIVVDRPDLFPDNWLYIHAPDVAMGRVTNFRNWSPDLYGDSAQTVLCVEYWCFAEDAIWQAPEAEMVGLATRELAQTGLCRPEDIVDGFIVRLPRTYPVYQVGYREHLDVLIAYLRGFANLQEIGRYGTYKYNNQDHSILMGYLAARNLAGEGHDLWEVNTDTVYYESGDAPSPGTANA